MSYRPDGLRLQARVLEHDITEAQIDELRCRVDEGVYRDPNGSTINWGTMNDLEPIYANRLKLSGSVGLGDDAGVLRKGIIESLARQDPQHGRGYLVMRRGEDRIGSCYAFSCYDTFAGRRGVWIRRMFVRPQFRRRGELAVFEHRGSLAAFEEGAVAMLARPDDGALTSRTLARFRTQLGQFLPAGTYYSRLALA